jgi:hypothetical protein
MVLGSIFDRHIHSRLDAKPMKTRSRLCRELQNLFGLGNDKGPQAPENHAHAMALHFLYYNFMRIHRTLKVTPAMAARVTDRLGKSPTLFQYWRHGNQPVLMRPIKSHVFLSVRPSGVSKSIAEIINSNRGILLRISSDSMLSSLSL